MKHVIWIVYTTFCLLVSGLPLSHAANDKNADRLLSCPEGYAYDVTRSVCVPVKAPSGAVPSDAALCDDCAKPDRHLVRIAGPEGVHEMCARLSGETGYRIATVDYVLWRAANLGMI